MGRLMAEPTKENARLAERLASIAAALKPPANGHVLPAGKPTVLTDQHFPALAKAIVPFVKETLAPLVARLDALEKKKGLAPLALRNAELEKRIVELEARPPPLQYQGVWSEEKTYQRGAFVTYQGGLWHCEDTNCGVRPGAGSTSWKLAVKRGRADR